MRRLVAFQALALGIAGSLLGIVGGLGLAHAIGALFDVLGLALPMTSMSLSGGAVIVALLIGIGVPLLASLRPPGWRRGSRRSARCARPSTVRVPGCSVAACGRSRRCSAVRPRCSAASPGAGAPQHDAPPGPHRGDRRRADDRRDARRGRRRHRRPGLKGSVSKEAGNTIKADLVISSEKDGWGATSPAALKRVVGGPGRASGRGSLAQDAARVGRTRITVDGVDAGAAKMLHQDVVAGHGSSPRARRWSARTSPSSGAARRHAAGR